MANAGEKYLINDIATKAALIVDLVNENAQLHDLMTDNDAQLIKMRALLTPAQQKKMVTEEPS